MDNVLFLTYLIVWGLPKAESSLSFLYIDSLNSKWSGVSVLEKLIHSFKMIGLVKNPKKNFKKKDVALLKLSEEQVIVRSQVRKRTLHNVTYLACVNAIE